MSTDSAARKRRTRDETRDLLLEAAVRLVESRVVGDGAVPVNPMADVLITDVIRREIDAPVDTRDED